MVDDLDLQFQQLKQQQIMKQRQQQQQHCSAAWGKQGAKPAPAVQQHQPAFHGAGFGTGRSGRPLGLPSSAWPPLQQHQQQPSSGMRAVFLGGPGSRRESSGTGVFLPRRAGNPTEMKKKPGIYCLVHKFRDCWVCSYF